MLPPDDDMKMSRHIGVQIIHCCDVYCYDINCAFVGYIENKTTIMGSYVIDVKQCS
jgi:hypothetical protein